MKRHAAVGVVLLMSSGCFLVTSGLTSGEDLEPTTSPDSATSDASRADGPFNPQDVGVVANDARAEDAGLDALKPDDGATTIDATLDAGVATKLVWVTSMAVTGDFGGLVAADLICTTEAGKPAFAYLETSTATADSRIPVGPTIEYRLPSGALVFSAGTALAVGPLLPINEFLVPVAGAPVTGQSRVWSGLSKATCIDWTTRTSGTGGTGLTYSAAQWNNGGVYPCGIALRLYCFQR